VGDRKLELLVGAVVLSLLLYQLLAALGRIQRDSEEAAVRAEMAAQRVELLDRLAHREAVGGPLPAGDNPVAWSGRTPPGYAGETAAPGGDGLWYFSPRTGMLTYRFRRGDEWCFRLVRGGLGDVRGQFAGIALAQQACPAAHGGD